MSQQAIEMEVGEFADWAVEQFGVDYDDVMLWDMLRDLDGKSRMSGDWEIGTRSDGDIPAELYDLLIARKQGRVTVKSPNVPTPVRPSEWEQRDGTAE